MKELKKLEEEFYYKFVSSSLLQPEFAVNPDRVWAWVEDKLSRPVQAVVMEKIAGIVDYGKDGKRQLAIMGLMIIGSVSYSQSTKSWFAKLYNIADITAEYETEQECKDLIQQEANEFLRKCLIAVGDSNFSA